MWIAITVKGTRKDGAAGYLAYTWKITEHDNLISVMDRLNPLFAHIYQTKKAADETVTFWNAGYVENGTYLYG